MSSNTCGCCKGVHPATPRAADNRHGLSSIAYRAGDHASFKRSMLASLGSTPYQPDPNVPAEYPLAGLTRDDDDFSIALLDAWASAADVLTFYQERIANESYLRTAGERLSVIELTRLIGYEPAPGVAASVWLSFTVDDSEGAPGQVTIPAGSKVQSVPPQDEMPQLFETSEELDARAEWNALVPRQTEAESFAAAKTSAYFAGTETNLRVGDALLFYRSGTVWNLCRVSSVTADYDNARTLVTWGPGLTTAFASATGTITVYAMRVKGSLFGHNAIDPQTMSTEALTGFGIQTTKKWAFTISNGTIYLDGEHPEIAVGSKALLQSKSKALTLYTVNAVAEITMSEYALTGRATQLTLSDDASMFGGDEYRSTVVYAASEALTLAEAPRSGTLGQTIELETAIDTLDTGRVLIISSADGSVTEVATVGSVDQTIDPLHTKLTLAAPLANTFDATTSRIFANVAAATHGETVREVLGSGDTATPFLRFKLAQGPLSYVPSSDGVESTLSVYVNDILWQETPALFGTTARDRVYETRRDEEEITTVQFGDGRTAGAPVPTGSDNVQAIYRKGIGDDANVDEHTLTTLMSQPLGLDGVDNPIAASGGEDPESIDDARANAPATTRTLDRVVSLTDYQAYAASFPGIRKAVATWTRAGTMFQVFLTIAGPDGATFTASSATLTTLREALLSKGDPFVPLRIASFRPVKFNVAAKVGVDADRVAEIVLQDVRDALAEAFAFDARSFGEPVDYSDLVAVMHSVDGVASVDVDLLYRVEPDGSHTSATDGRLAAASARQLSDGTLQSAEILILGDATIMEAS